MDKQGIIIGFSSILVFINESLAYIPNLFNDLLFWLCLLIFQTYYLLLFINLNYKGDCKKK